MTTTSLQEHPAGDTRETRALALWRERSDDRLARMRDRYRNELMDEDERLELRDRIARLARKEADDELDAQWSCLERMGL